jgi:hypothetical protein
MAENAGTLLLRYDTVAVMGLTNNTFLLKCGQDSKRLRPGNLTMKNVYEVLRQKEQELAKLEREVEALRVAAPLLTDDKEISSDTSKPTLTSASPQQPIRIPQPAANPAPQPARAVGWEDTGKRWP